MDATFLWEGKRASKLEFKEPYGKRCDAHGEECVLRFLLAHLSCLFDDKFHSVMNAWPKPSRKDKEKPAFILRANQAHVSEVSDLLIKLISEM